MSYMCFFSHRIEIGDIFKYTVRCHRLLLFCKIVLQCNDCFFVDGLMASFLSKVDESYQVGKEFYENNTLS